MGDPNFGRKTRRWLVSCKHTAAARGGKGRSVGTEDIGLSGGIVDAVHEHHANGFLLACSTQASSSLVRRLTAIEIDQRIPTHVWDGVYLERMLATPKGWQISQRFMPISADKSGWQIFMTDAPNRFIGITRGYYIRLVNRHGSVGQLLLEEIDRVLDWLEKLQPPKHYRIRPRGIYHNDKSTTFTWYIDCIHLDNEKDDASIVNYVKSHLIYLPHEGIDHEFQVRAEQDFIYGDSYDDDHHKFYRHLPRHFWVSG